MKEIEMEGKTVTMAVESGLKELGLRRDQVEVQVLDEGNAGFLGMGAKPAKVRIREKLWGTVGLFEEEADDNRGNRIQPEPPPKPHRGGNRPSRPASAYYDDPPARPARGRSGGGQKRPARSQPRAPEKPRKPVEEIPVDTAKACEHADAVLREMLSLTGLAEPKVRCAWDTEQNRVKADIDTVDSDLLIGKDGKTLEALQFLVTIIVGRKVGSPVAVQVETAGYWKGIEERILAEVQKAVSEVKKTQRPYRFDPMEPALRRLVHRSVVNDPEVETASEGEGSWRKVVLRPKARR